MTLAKSSRRAPKSKARKPDSDLLRLFTTLMSGPPLLPGEKRAEYNWLQGKIFEALCPKDTIETIWAKDIADATFEIERYRRLKQKYIASGRRQKLIDAIAQITVRDPGGASPTKMAAAFVNECLSEEKGELRILARLRKHGIDPDHLLAETVWARMEAVERFEVLIIQAEKKRDGLIWQLDRYRNRARPKRRDPGVVDLAPDEFT